MVGLLVDVTLVFTEGDASATRTLTVLGDGVVDAEILGHLLEVAEVDELVGVYLREVTIYRLHRFEHIELGMPTVHSRHDGCEKLAFLNCQILVYA